MNKKHFFTIGITASAIMLAISGCHVPTIKAEFKMPPRVISDIGGIDPMEIVVNVNLKGNKITKGDDSIAKSAICERIAAGFCNEKSYKTVDFVEGDKVGANKMLTLLQSKKSQHGYINIAHTPQTTALLEITLTAQVDAFEKDINVNTDLKKVYYKDIKVPSVVVWYEGKNMKSETVYIPSSIPARTEKSVATSKLKETVVSATGSFSAQITDKKGKIVYKRLNNNLRFSAICNHKNLDAMPNNAEILSALTNNAIKDIIKDLSTYTETRELKINKDGNEKVFYLLESLAFGEVNGYAEKVYAEIEDAKNNVEKPEGKITFQDYKKYLSKETQELTFADFENFAISYEVSGSLDQAREFYAIALELKKADKGLFDYDVEIAEKGLARLNAPKKSKKAKSKKAEVSNITGNYYSTSLELYPNTATSQSFAPTSTTVAPKVVAKPAPRVNRYTVRKPVPRVNKAPFKRPSKMVNRQFNQRRPNINRARVQKPATRKAKMENVKKNNLPQLNKFF
jgi:hypothetical protein